MVALRAIASPASVARLNAIRAKRSLRWAMTPVTSSAVPNEEEGVDRDTRTEAQYTSNAQNRDIRSRREQAKQVRPDQAPGGTGTLATQKIDWPKDGWMRRSMARSAGTTSLS